MASGFWHRNSGSCRQPAPIRSDRRCRWRWRSSFSAPCMPPLSAAGRCPWLRRSNGPAWEGLNRWCSASRYCTRNRRLQRGRPGGRFWRRVLVWWSSPSPMRAAQGNGSCWLCGRAGCVQSALTFQFYKKKLKNYVFTTNTTTRTMLLQQQDSYFTLYTQ